MEQKEEDLFQQIEHKCLFQSEIRWNGEINDLSMSLNFLKEWRKEIMQMEKEKSNGIHVYIFLQNTIVIEAISNWNPK